MSNEEIINYYKNYFNLYQATNNDGSKEGLITGYYQPLLKGNWKKTKRYNIPLYSIPDDLITVNLSENVITCEKTQETIKARERYGLLRALLNNMIKGVHTKFEKKLQMIGVGYKAQVQNKKLTLNVGFSHPVIFTIPEDLEIIVDANTNLTIKGSNKETVGLYASKIRAIRPPEPYKGKGIRYTDEVVLRKAGKSGK